MTEQPHWIEPDMDCGGRMQPGYWRQFIHCSDGSVVMGCGLERNEAERKAKVAWSMHEETLKLSPRERLAQFLVVWEHEKRQPYHAEINEAIILLIKLSQLAP